MHMQFSAVASLRTFVPWCALQGHDLPQSLCFLAWLFVGSQGLRGSSIFTLEPKDSNCVNSRQGSDSRGPHKTQWVSAFGFASPFGLKPAKWKMSRFNDHTVVRGSRPNLYHQYAAIKVLGLLCKRGNGAAEGGYSLGVVHGHGKDERVKGSLRNRFFCGLRLSLPPCLQSLQKYPPLLRKVYRGTAGSSLVSVLPQEN